MRKVTCTKGYFALVDDADYPLVSQYSWSVAVRKYTVYAYAYNGGGHIGHKIAMHRLIMQPKAHEHIDHVNGNGLDCQRHNMRKCSPAQNLCNRLKYKNTGKFSSSRFKGVVRRTSNRWQAVIWLGGKAKYLGMFPSEEQAARAYDTAAKQHYGEFARTNL